MIGPFRRGLEPMLRSALATSRVVVLEGGRGVGKTTLCRQLQEDDLVREIVDLSEPGTFESARMDPTAFIQRLRLPAVIDEVQLLEDHITPAVKRYVDQVGLPPGRFILTGSTRLTRGALGGSDPLAGRAVRLRLHSFTQAERNGNPFDLLPHLHRGDFVEHRLERIDDNDIKRRILLGGLPSVPGVLAREGSPQMRRESIGAYVEGVLHKSLGESRTDRIRILDTFRAIAGTPAQILNLETLARDLRIASLTLKGYVALLESSFLLEQIPSWASDARREVQGHPRLVPSDVSLAVWAGLHTLDTLNTKPTSMGPLLHTLVVNELCAQSAWSEYARVLHWRRRNVKVDTVLQFPDGVLVGVEVKAARAVNRSDVAGLRTFLGNVPEATHGVIFHLGDFSTRLEPNIWALPIQALWDKSFSLATQIIKSSNQHMHKELSALSVEKSSTFPFGGSGMTSKPRTTTGENEFPSDAAMFVSYVHADNDAEGGRIVQFARDIAERYRLNTGEELEVFIDKDSLRWGDEWQIRLDEQLTRTTFFVPIVTPRFLRSEACRQEVLKFVGSADSAGLARYVLPIKYIKTQVLDKDDPVAEILGRHQWEDWSETRYEEPGSGTYRREIDRLCMRLADAVATMELDDPVIPASSREKSVDEDDDLLLLFERISSAAEKLTPLLPQFERALEAVTEVHMPARSNSSSPGQMRSALRLMAGQLSEPIKMLDLVSSLLRSQMKEIDENLNELVQATRSDPQAAHMWGANLASLRMSLPDGMDLDQGQLNIVRDQMRFLGRMARELRGPTQSIESALLLISDMGAMLQRWRDTTQDL